MKKIMIVIIAAYFINGCASPNWKVKREFDEFTEENKCEVVSLKKQRGQLINYYPMVKKIGDDAIFAMKGDFGMPVGDIHVKVDNNEPIFVSYKETPILGNSKTLQPSYDFSAINVEGLDTEKMKKSMEKTYEDITKMSSPFTAASPEKSKTIIGQMMNGNLLKVKVESFGVNDKKFVGKYPIDQSFKQSLATCGLI